MARAVDAGADIIGINNRNLKTFEVDAGLSERLRERVPDSCVAVSESGLESAEELQRLRAAGFDAFLIGTHLMQAPDPGAALGALLGPGAARP